MQSAHVLSVRGSITSTPTEYQKLLLAHGNNSVTRYLISIFSGKILSEATVDVRVSFLCEVTRLMTLP